MNYKKTNEKYDDIIINYLLEIKQFDLTNTIIELQTNKLIRNYYKTITEQKTTGRNANYNNNNQFNRQMIMVIDTETTGFPVKRSFNEYHHYSCTEKYDNSRIVSFSYALYNKNGENLDSDNLLIKPCYNSKILEDSTKIHHITYKMLTDNGVSMTTLADILYEKLKNVSIIVGHNIQFDLNILKSELYRIKRNEIIKQLIDKRDLCTMFYSCSVTKLSFPNSTKNNDSSYISYKPPSLPELFKFLFGMDLENAHQSNFDVINCAKCFFELVKRKIIKI